jgi:hypothetical protein
MDRTFFRNRKVGIFREVGHRIIICRTLCAKFTSNHNCYIATDKIMSDKVSQIDELLECIRIEDNDSVDRITKELGTSCSTIGTVGSIFKPSCEIHNIFGLLYCSGSGSMGETPIFVACAYGNVVAVEKLLEQGADIFGPDNQGNTPLFAAVESKNLEIIKKLMDAGYDSSAEKLNAKCYDGNTAFHRACLIHNIEIAEYLFSMGADINIADEDGNTPLHNAVASGDLEVFNMLLRHGSKSGCENTAGSTPLIVAIKLERTTMLKKLKNLNAGAVLSINQRENRCAACFATEVPLLHCARCRKVR